MASRSGPAGQHVEVIGADTFARTNSRVAARLGDLSTINGVSARYVAARASVYAPKLTGRLAGSIRGTGEPDAAVISANTSYAAVQEFGWPGHNIRGVRYMGRAGREGQAGAIRAHTAQLDLLLSGVKGA